MENFVAFKKRVEPELRGKGLWDDFLRLREAYKLQGMSPQDAWRLAYDQIKDSTPSGEPFVWVKERNQGLKGALPTILKNMGGKVPAPSGSDNDLYSRIKHKTAPPATVMHWVFNHAGLELSDLDVDAIPSPGALKLLQRVQTSDAAYDAFFAAYTKLLPSRTQLDAEARFQDDGRESFRLLDDLEAELNAGSQGTEGERGVSPPPGETIPDQQGSEGRNLDRVEAQPAVVD